MMKCKQILFHLNISFLKCLLISIVIFSVTACTENKNNEPTIILLPEDYIGSFYIIFEVPKGEPPTYEKNTRVYKIPLSGVLLTQTDLSSSTLHYYYVNSDGTRTAITDRWTTSIHDTPENRQDDRITIFGGGIGEIEPVSNCKATQLRFIVGTKSDVLDKKNIFGIYDAKGIKNMDRSIFAGMCP